MDLLNPLLMLLFSLLGFPLGLILGLMAPEELKPGKKCFVLIRKILFYLIVIFFLFSFIYFKKYYFVLVPLVYLGLYLTLIKKQKDCLKEIINYSFFILAYFLMIIFITENNLPLIIPSLIFLYGLPAGSLTRLRTIKQQQTKYLKKIKIKHV